MNPATARNVAINALKASCHNCLLHASLAREDVMMGRYRDVLPNTQASEWYLDHARKMGVRLHAMGLGQHASDKLAETERILDSIIAETEDFRRNQGEEAANV